MFMENRYDKYKDSGIEWIGEIPEHWETSKTLFSLSIPITDGPHTTPELFETGIPFVSAEAVSFGNGRIDFSHIRGYISDNFYQECCKKYIPQIDDIYMIKSGATTGRVAIVDTDVKFTIWSPLAVFRCNKERMLPHFLFYQLQSNGYQKQIELNWSYGTQQNIGMRTLEKLILSVPPIAEQQSIANYLDQKCGEIDELITLQEGMITKLQSYKQSVITEAVTKGLDKNVPLKDSGIEWVGEIPKHWEVKRLKNVCSTNNASLSDKTSKEFEFDYVDIGSVSFELGIHKTEKYTFQNAPSRARKIARLGDIIVSTVRTYLRAIDIINSEEKEKYIYSTGFAILSPLKNILSEFMIYICRSEYFTNQVSIYSTGINYPSINDTALKMIYIVMPPLSEQQSIATYLDQKCSEIDELISIKQQKIEKLKDYKKSLIFECVTGKRKV